MVLKPTEERIKTLLKDTITLLCKNGLTFQSEFSIEALIGITLDKDQVLLFSINENVESDKPVPELQLAVESPDEASTSAPRHRSKRRRRKRSSVSNSSPSDVSDVDDTTSSQEDTKPKFSESSVTIQPTLKRKSSDGGAESSSQASKRRKSRASTEQPQDVIHIKEEVTDDWQNQDTTATETYPTYMTDSQGAHVGMTDSQGAEASMLSDTSMVPMDGGGEGWADNQGHYLPGTSTSVVTPGGSRNNAQGYSQILQLEEAGWSCGICGVKLRSKYSLQTHSRLHTGEYRHTCGVCGKGFMTTAHLEGHMVTHTGIKQYSCHLCGSSYSYKCKLTYHMKVKRPDGQGWDCEVCGLKLSSKNALQTHSRRHTGHFRYACNICGKGFMGITDLNAHMASHTGIKPFCCHLCDKGYTYRRKLKQHLKNKHNIQ